MRGRTGTAAAFPFGFGLSYTSFEVSKVRVDVTADGIVARGEVTNNGDRAGAHVVQVSAVLPDPEAPPRLAGFARVEVAAGDRRSFEIAVPLDRFATRDTAARGWRSPTGIHRIVVGTFAGDPDATEVDVDLGA